MTTGSLHEHASLPDCGRLAPWMVRHVRGFRGPLRALALSGGQSNPTFKLTSDSGTYVLRRKPLGPILPSAHAVEREFRILESLHGTAVPVPPVHALCEDPDIVGSSFYVMDFVPGRIFLDVSMPGVTAHERHALFDSMNQTIASLHALRPEQVGLQDFGRPENYLQRQVTRWTRQYRASITEPIPQMEPVIEWLTLHMPGERGGRLVHGDFKLDNMIFHPTEPRVVAVLDWELATVGDPLADFAYHVMPWHLAPDLFRGWAGLDLHALGIPTEEEYVLRYAGRSGLTQSPDWRFYLVFSMFRLAAILQGIAKRAADGTAADQAAAQVGRQARPVAARAWELASAANE